MVDYAIFIGNGVTITHIGDINNVSSFAEAKSKLLRNPSYRNKRFFLINKDNFIEVKT